MIKNGIKCKYNNFVEIIDANCLIEFDCINILSEIWTGNVQKSEGMSLIDLKMELKEKDEFSF